MSLLKEGNKNFFYRLGMKMETEINNQINLFIENVQKRIDEHYKKDLPNSTPPKITSEFGAKYCRIVQEYKDRSGKGVFCFIVLEDGGKFRKGDILKAESWKAPAKNSARGNIFDSLERGVSVYGANYIR